LQKSKSDETASFLRMQESPYKLILRSNKEGDACIRRHDNSTCFGNFAAVTI